MNEISYEELLQIHKATLSMHGGLPGVKDEGLLLSALAQPSSSFGEVDAYPTFPEKIAALGFSLAKNHAFNDGNKRVSFAAMSVFALKNGYLIEIPEKEVVVFMLGLAASEKTRADLVEWISQHLEMLEPVMTAQTLAERDQKAIRAMLAIASATGEIELSTREQARHITEFNLTLQEKTHQLNALTNGPRGLVASRGIRIATAMGNATSTLANNLELTLPKAEAAVDTISNCVPVLVESMFFTTESDKTAGFQALLAVGKMIDAVNESLEQLQGMQDAAEEMQKAMPSLKPHCRKLDNALHKMKVTYNENWFAHKDLIETLKTRI